MSESPSSYVRTDAAHLHRSAVELILDQASGRRRPAKLPISPAGTKEPKFVSHERPENATVDFKVFITLTDGRLLATTTADSMLAGLGDDATARVLTEQERYNALMAVMLARDVGWDLAFWEWLDRHRNDPVLGFAATWLLLPALRVFLVWGGIKVVGYYIAQSGHTLEGWIQFVVNKIGWFAEEARETANLNPDHEVKGIRAAPDHWETHHHRSDGDEPGQGDWHIPLVIGAVYALYHFVADWRASNEAKDHAVDSARARVRLEHTIIESHIVGMIPMDATLLARVDEALRVSFATGASGIMESRGASWIDLACSSGWSWLCSDADRDLYESATEAMQAQETPELVYANVVASLPGWTATHPKTAAFVELLKRQLAAVLFYTTACGNADLYARRKHALLAFVTRSVDGDDAVVRAMNAYLWWPTGWLSNRIHSDAISVARGIARRVGNRLQAESLSACAPDNTAWYFDEDIATVEELFEREFIRNGEISTDHCGMDTIALTMLALQQKVLQSTTRILTM